MLSLWSRAAQAQSSCRCRICHHHTGNSLVRRSTTAAPRRKPTVADIFTACYTTLLGTAAIIDAHHKDVRRQELDSKLEKARAALDSSSPAVLEVPELADQPDQLDLPDEPLPAEERRRDESVPTNPRHNSGSSVRRRAATKALLAELGALSFITSRPLPRPSWLQTQIDWLKVETAIVSEERNPYYNLREPKSPEQLRQTTESVVDLVNRLLEQSQSAYTARPQDSAGYNGGLTAAENLISEKLEAIQRSQDYPSYEDPLTDVESTAATRYLLGQSIRRIFNQAASSREIVGKICYNLVTSSAPPTIHTYNTLIAGFNRVQRPDLAQAVIDSYIHATAWPATQQTIVCLLDHYRGTNQRKRLLDNIRRIKGVRDTVQRMRGVKDTGLHFRIIDKRLIYSEAWLAWAKENCASRKHAFVERAHRSDDVFNSLIRAWLYLGEVGNASKELVTCISSGATISVQTLQELFTACLVIVDHAAARRIVRGIARNFPRFASFFEGIIYQESIETARRVATSFSHVLDICLLPFKDIVGPIGDVFEQVTWKLKSFIHKILLRLELEEAAELCTVTAKQLQSNGSLIGHTEKAISNFDFAQRSRHAIEHTFMHFDRVARLFSIERRYHDLETRIRGLTAEVKAVILKIKTGYDVDPCSRLGSEQPLSSIHERNRYFALRNALQDIQIHSGPMTQDDIKLQLLQRLPDPILVKKLQDSGNPENLSIITLVSLHTPNALIPRKPKTAGCGGTIEQLEQELNDVNDSIRAILFAYLNVERQKTMRSRYANWYAMPLEPLFNYHLKRRPKSRPQLYYHVSLFDQQSWTYNSTTPKGLIKKQKTFLSMQQPTRNLSPLILDDRNVLLHRATLSQVG